MADQQVQYVITAVDRSRAAFASIEGGFAKLQAGAASLQSALAGVAALGALTGAAAAFRSTVESLDPFNDAADATGVSVENLSSLLNTLAPTGANLAQISDLAGKVQRAMAGADEETSKAAAAFKALGVSTLDASGNLRNVDDVLVDVSQALSTYADGSNKTAIAQALLGKSGAEYLPILKDLANRQRESATVSSAQAEAAEKLAIQWGVLKTAADNLRIQLAGPLISALGDIIERFNAAGTASENFYNRLRLALQPDREIGRLQGNVRDLETELRGLQNLKVLPEFETDRLAELENVTKRLAQARKELGDAQPVAALQQRSSADLRRLEDRGFTPTQSQAPRLADAAKLTKAAKDQVSEAERLLQTLTQQLDKTRDLSTEQEILAQIGRGEIAGLNPALEQQILLRAAQIDKVKAEAKAREELKKAIDDLYASEQKEQEALAAARQPLSASLASQAAQILRDLPSAVQGAKAELTKYFDERLIDGLLNEEDWKAAIGKINGLQDNAKEKSAEANDAARELGLTFQSAFEDAVVEGKKLSDVLGALAQDLARLVIRKSLTEPLANIASGFLTETFGFGATKRATGGSAKAGMPYIVGDGGRPELFVPGVNGRIVPSVPEGGGMNFTMNVASGVTRQELLAAGESFITEAQSRIYKSMRNGGVFA